MKRMPRRPRSNKLPKINKNPLRSPRLKKLKLNRRNKRSLKLSSLKSSGLTLMQKRVKRDLLDMILMNQSAPITELQTRNITGLKALRVLTFRSSYLKAPQLKILRL